MRRTVATEHAEQVALFAWAAHMERKYPALKWMFAIPNGGHRNVIVARKLKAEGVKRGVPDIFVPTCVGRLAGLWIELKRTKGGRVSEEQLDWHHYLANQGYSVKVCYGWQAAAVAIVSYLEGGVLCVWRDGRVVHWTERAA